MDNTSRLPEYNCRHAVLMMRKYEKYEKTNEYRRLSFAIYLLWKEGIKRMPCSKKVVYGKSSQMCLVREATHCVTMT